MSFSKRMGYAPSFKDIQRESMDSDLRNGLWNILNTLIFETLLRNNYTSGGTRFIILYRNHLWHQYFKLTLDDAPTYESDIILQVRQYYFHARWNNVYDFIEFILRLCKEDVYNSRLGNPAEIGKTLNVVLQKEFSAYRIIEGIVVPVTNEQEIESIESAQQIAQETVKYFV